MSRHPNFTLTEFTASSTASRQRIDNTLPADLVPEAIKTLEMLQRIRDWLSKQAGRDVPVAITSGYRGPALNKAIGSKASSDHIRAQAVDWSAPAFGRPVDICRALAPMVGVLGIGQLINEFPSAGGGWVHTSTRVPEKVVNRVITITHAGTFAGVHEA